jgi:hypothetical protein
METRKRFGIITGLCLVAGFCNPWFQSHTHAAGTVSICDEAHLRTALVGGGLVTFASDGTIPLAGTLIITNATTINGAGHAVTLSGNNAVQVFTANGPSLSLINLTIANGLAAGTNGSPGVAGGAGQGGGVRMNGGTLNTVNCQFVGNHSLGGNGGVNPNLTSASGNGGNALGGAIDLNAGNLNATNCQFYDNSADGGTGGDLSALAPAGGFGGSGFGGAIHAATSAVTLVGCEFQTNGAHGGLAGTYVSSYPGSSTSGAAFGGALCQQGGFFTNINCQFIGNVGFTPDIPGLSNIRSLTGSPAQGGAVFSDGITGRISGGTFTSNTVTGGNAAYIPVTPGPGQGGAVYHRGTLQISNCWFIANAAFGGRNGQLAANGEGGALYCTGSVSLVESVLSGNTVQGGPGFQGGLGGYKNNGSGRGGAIFNSGLLQLIRSTLSENFALGTTGSVSTPSACPPSSGFGGAVFNSGTLTATNSTLAGNQAVGADMFANYYFDGGDGLGGGIFNAGGTIVLLNNTIAENVVQGGAGATNGIGYGAGIFSTNGSVTVFNTILANSSGGGTNCFGTLIDGGQNISSDASCAFVAAGSLNNTDPVISPLGDFGGPTLTMALLSGSPAIDASNPVNSPGTDQRGRSRATGPAPDIGAFESAAPYTILGTITGPAAQFPMNVVAGSTNGPLINGSYAIHGLGATTYVVTPNTANYLFIPANQLVTMGPDKVGVDFKSYTWQALTLEEITNGSMHLIFALSNAPTFRVFASADLQQWSVISTNSVGTSNYSSFFIPTGNEPAQFFRAIIP